MDSSRCRGPYEKTPLAPGTNQTAGFVEFRPLMSRKKDKLAYGRTYVATTFFLDRWVNKVSKIWGFVPTPLARSGSAIRKLSFSQ